MVGHEFNKAPNKGPAEPNAELCRPLQECKRVYEPVAHAPRLISGAEANYAKY